MMRGDFTAGLATAKALRNLLSRIAQLNLELGIDYEIMRTIMLDIGDFETPLAQNPQEVADHMFKQYENVARGLKSTICWD